MFLTAFALVLAAGGAADRIWSIDQASSTIRFQVEHRLHRIDGASTRLEGKAVAKADGQLLAMVRAPVSTFQSVDANRDAHMLEVLEASRYPQVTFKGVGRPGSALPERGRPGALVVQLDGEVELHGVKRPVSVPLQLDFLADGTVRARGAFTVSLEAHQVERPALLFVKVEDACAITVDLLLRESAP